MSRSTKIGIVGCGVIGSFLAEAVTKEFAGQLELSAIFDIDNHKISVLADKLKNRKLIVLNLEELIGKSNLVIEATHADSAYEIALRTISLRRDIMVMSVGGILEKFFELKQLAQEKKVRLIVPSGAICGVDGLKAVAEANAKIDKVMLTSRKPISAFKDNPYVLKKKINLDQVKEDTLLFSGNASEAVRFFPQNINVCATLAIVLGDPKKLEVNIIASPRLQRNIHEVQIESEAGRIYTCCENVIHPHNPKTSFLAIRSALACLRGFFQSVKVGT